MLADETLTALARLVVSVPAAPGLSALVQQHLLPLVPFFLRNVQLPPSVLEPLVTPVIVPSLAATLSLPPRIDRHRFTLGESLSALTSLLRHDALSRRMLAADAWRPWLLPAVKGLWDGPKKGTGMRDRTIKLLGCLVRVLTIELDVDADEERKWAVERQVVAEKIGEELQVRRVLLVPLCGTDLTPRASLQTLLNSELPEPHPDPEVKTWLDLLTKQLDAAQERGPDGEEPPATARFGIVSLLAVLPPLMRSSFRHMEHKMVLKEGGVLKPQQGIGPWLRPVNQLQAHPDPAVLVLSTLAWSHLAFAFCGTVSAKGVKSWVLRMPDRRPFIVFSSILHSRKECWNKRAEDEVDPVRRNQRREQARALTLAMAGIAYGATVHILHGISPVRDPAAPIDPPTSPRRLEQFDFVAKELLKTYLPLATASPPVSASVAVLGWELLSNIVRPRTAQDRGATLDKLVNSAFLDGTLAGLAQDKVPLFLASAMDRAVQPKDVPGWGVTWITTRVDKVLELLEACLPRTHMPEELVMVRLPRLLSRSSTLC